MFQPQPTPYSPFASSFGVVDDDGGYAFPPTSLELNSGGAIVFDNPTFNPVRSQYIPSNLDNPASYNNMEAPPEDNDMAAQEALAREYQPDLKGPLVGNKKSSRAITEEYAKADPIYVAKTLVLPQKYSHYRQVLGDGKCGWRALGFSYFEMLLQLGDEEQVNMERARMMSLTHFVVQSCGHADWTFEDMRDECLDLLKIVQDTIHLGPQPDSSSVILERFNDGERSDQIVFWFRLLASAYLRANSDAYEGFIIDSISPESYAKDVLEPPNAEIEHLGIILLVEILVKPINVSLEIVYLDRTGGTEANVHTYGVDNDSPGRPTIHLLYRPGHYDILYRKSELQQNIVEQAAELSNLQVNRASSFSYGVHLQGTSLGYHPGDISALTDIPFLSGASASNHGLFNDEVPFESTPISSYPHVDSLAPSPGAGISPTSPLSPGSGSSTFATTTLPIHAPPGSADSSQSQFRPSKYELENDWRDVKETPAFQTTTFKNSHFNTAHFNNPNFHPEEWSPGCEEAVGKHGKERHRSS